MEFFDAIGRDLTERWRREGGSVAAFSALAAAVLRDHDPAAHVTPGDIAERLLDAARLPAQAPVSIEYPFTLFRCEQFTVSAFFWVDGTVDIHDHAFWGAFQVAAGSSIHVRYRYTELERITPGMSRGELASLGAEELRRGDVREIVPGRGFIHGLFHIERPTVTVLIATAGEPRHGPAFSYLHPGLAVNVFAKDAERERRLKALSLVAATWPNEYPAAVSRFINDGAPDDAFRGLQHAFKTLDGDGFDAVLGAARAAHGPLANLWQVAFEESRRQANIIERRAFIHDPVHRFFLAVVLNAPDRATILRMVAERVPGVDPVDTIMGWVRELSEIAVDGPAGPTAIGAPLDEASLIVLRALMVEGDEAHVFAALAQEFDSADVEAQRDDILELIEAYRSSLFFKPLLQSEGLRERG